MKIMIHSDNHWSERSSIVASFGYKYSTRLEQLIKGINWAFDTAKEHNCTATICCGDFFDKPNLTQQELTALQEISWPKDLTNYFLVGNHESEETDLHYSSTEILKSNGNTIIAKPTTIILNDVEFNFLPYIPESERQPLADYFPNKKNKEIKYRILISHNDISGISYGPVISSIGFSKEELSATFDLALNGHIHNQSWITDNLLDVGSFSAHNFTNDSFTYSYGIWILDTDTLKIEYIENPHAFNFYKLEILQHGDLQKFEKLKNNAVVSIQCAASLLQAVKEKLQQYTNKIVNTRIITVHDNVNTSSAVDVSNLTVDHHARFASCCRERLGESEILETELAEILK